MSGAAASSARLRYTPRDLDVLDDLASYRFLSVPQLQALHFPTKGTAETRLRTLYQHELVVRLYMPARAHDRRVASIYGLSRKGAQLLRDRHDGVAPPHLSPKDERSALFLDHTLRRNDLRICLMLLARENPAVELVSWQQLPDEVKAHAEVPDGRDDRRVTLIPDAMFVLRVGTIKAAFAVEIDMGTVRLTSMAERYRAYWCWWKAGGAEKRFGPLPFRVLTLTTTNAHLEALRRAAITAPVTGRKGSGLFWFALHVCLDLHRPASVLDPAWKVARVTRSPEQGLRSA
jgi:hypothetical protein